MRSRKGIMKARDPQNVRSEVRGISKLVSTSSLAPNTSGNEEIWKQQHYSYILAECLQVINRPP
jgi:hypothetical protein